ncbi:MAG: 2-oxo-4-hydroxy-4-carboxy-5-ureidoimidazoline decarboxylase [Myxococcota bacterium]|nr:2-oxo-4-hydroxy-4-carboxy-5-ureidoimidazoline decarboxylase [Myxococcota bacterium]
MSRPQDDTGLSGLNAAPAEEAKARLLRCCGSHRWAEQLTAARPFPDRAALFAAASRIWNEVGREDWLEAFSHHPRIGDRKLESAGAGTKEWAKGEQAGMNRADENLRAAIAEGNAAYEARYGRVYLVCATGKSAGELLAILQSRLGNDPDTELRIAAAEQDKITRIRLEKLLSP